MDPIVTQKLDELIANKKTVTVIADELQVSRQTVYKWLSKYKRDNSEIAKALRERSTLSAHNKIPSQVESVVISLAEKYPEESVSALTSKLKTNYKIVLNSATVFRILKRNNIRYGKGFVAKEVSPEVSQEVTPSVEIEETTPLVVSPIPVVQIIPTATVFEEPLSIHTGKDIHTRMFEGLYKLTAIALAGLICVLTVTYGATRFESGTIALKQSIPYNKLSSPAFESYSNMLPIGDTEELIGIANRTAPATPTFSFIAESSRFKKSVSAFSPRVFSLSKLTIVTNSFAKNGPRLSVLSSVPLINYTNYLFGGNIARAENPTSNAFSLTTNFSLLDRFSLALFCGVTSFSSEVKQERCNYDKLASLVDGSVSIVPVSEEEVVGEEVESPQGENESEVLTPRIVQNTITRYITSYIGIPGPAGKDGTDGKDGVNGITSAIPPGYGSYTIPSYSSPSTSIGVSTISYLRQTTIELPVITGGTATNLSLITPTVSGGVFSGLSLFNDSANFTGSVNINNLTATSSTVTNLTSTNATTTDLFSTNGTFTNLFATNATTTNAYIDFLTVGSSTAGSLTLSGTLNVAGTSTLATTTASSLTAANATTTNLFTQNLSVGNASTTGNQSIDGQFNVSGTSTLGANVFLNGSVVVGTSTNNMFTVNALINSNLTPAQNITYDLGSPSFYWRNLYANNINVNSISAASTTISGTSNNDFIVNSDNGTTDAEDASFVFFRGLTTPNALLRWNATTKRIESNMSFKVQNETPTTGTTTLTVQSGAGQGSTNLFELLNYAGTKLSAFTKDGWLGIGTSTPSTSLHLATNDGLIIPSGTTAQRPVTTLPGVIRYNTTNTGFEGYNGSTWGSLGGVSDADQNTYISAENSAGSNNDELKFYTGGTLRGIFSPAGNFGIGTSTPGSVLTVVGTTSLATTTVTGLTVSGQLQIGNASTTNMSVSNTLQALTIIGTNSSVTNASSTNLFANNLVATVATTSALVGGSLTATSSLVSNGTLQVTGQTVLGTASSTGLTATNVYGTNSTITNATSSSFFSTLISAVTAMFTNLSTTGTTTLATNGGSVGVGTNNPSSKLDVTSSNLGTTQTNSSGIALVNTTAASSVIGGVASSTAGALSPGTMADVATVGTRTWTSPDNAKVNDGVFATVYDGTSSSGSHYLKATNFGFSIPTGATINGIVVSVVKKASVNGLTDYINDTEIKIVKSTGVVGTTNKAAAVNPPATNWPTTSTTSLYGSASDLWGETWTAADINSANFGMVLAAFMNDGDNIGLTASVDHISITVYYSAASETVTNQISPAFRWSANGWKTAATAGSQTVDFRSFVTPVTGLSNPTGYLSFGSSINGAAYNDGLLTIGSAGNIGIGTTSPTSVLSIGSSTATGSTSLFSIASSTNLFTVLADGKVGIGTSSPAYTLDVNGTVNATNFYKNGTPFLAGSPANTIASFNQATCPAGWILADGTSGTPDLRGVYVRGAGTSGSYTKAAGGAYSATFGTFQNDAFQGHLISYLTAQAGASATIHPIVVGPFNAGTYTIESPNSAAIVSDGVNGTPRVSNETRPASYALTYCMKTTEDADTTSTIWGSSGANVFLQDTSKNLGIGTTSPISVFTVASSTATSTASIFSVASSTTLFNVLSNGNVGIGVSPLNFKLQVNGSVKFGGLITAGTSGGNYGSIGYNFRTTGTTDVYTYDGGDTSSRLEFTSGGFKFKTAAAGIAGNTVTYTDMMQLTHNGELTVRGNVINNAPSVGYLSLSGDLPGYANNIYPTLKTNAANIYFAVGGYYAAHMNTGGVVTAVSDRAKKENFVEIDPEEILGKIDQLPMLQWNYKSEDASVRHIAPIAQDFYSLFGLNGTDDKMISSIDPAGVALVGVKALSNKLSLLATGITVSSTVASSTRLFVNTSTGVVGIGNDGTSLGGELLRVSGTVRATGFDIDNASDIAETFPASEAVDAGTIVAFATTTYVWSPTATSTDAYEMSGVRKAHTDYEAIGIISTQPGIRLGGTTANGVPVAFTGRVPVKITKENGDVTRGDYITVSKTRPGYGMKLTGEGKAIGIAVSDDTGRDTVLVLLQVGNHKLDMQGRNATTTAFLTTGNVDLNANGVAIINIKSLASANGTWSIDENGKIVAKMLCLDEVCIDKSVLSNILSSFGQQGAVAGTSTTTVPDTATTTDSNGDDSATSTEESVTPEDSSMVDETDSTTPTDTEISVEPADEAPVETP